MDSNNEIRLIWLNNLLQKHGYTLLNSIGKGSYGECFTVHSAKYQIDFVCKVFYLPSDEKQTVIKRSFDTECNALTRVMHPNIINIFDYFSSNELLCIILEYCAHGSVQQLLLREKRLDENRLFHYSKNLIDALQYLHSHHFVHLDIKPGNMLIDNAGRVKLADFGLARIWDSDQQMNIFSGSYAYMAPEILKKKPFDPFKADVWSLGITLYQMATGQLPFIAKTLSSFIGLIDLGYPALPPTVPMYIRNIISLCLVPIPERRASIQDIQSYMHQQTLQFKSFLSSDDFKLVPGPSNRFVRKKKNSIGASPLQKSASHFAIQLTIPRSASPVPSPSNLPQLKKPTNSIIAA